MARVKRTNWAKTKIWGETITSEMEGPIAFIAVETFGMAGNRAAREALLLDIQKRHEDICGREAKRELATQA